MLGDVERSESGELLVAVLLSSFGGDADMLFYGRELESTILPFGREPVQIFSL